ncbi:MAG: nucleotidyl transferase AbiEii/AbiGii toxin family protein [bacterium]|nr:nucleotidyl transferase AbiEii/AbiGii toxin family protein [bacterium]
MGINKNKHKEAMVKLLKEIYFDTELSTLLGFKGGSAAMFFYDLPRFSVDLDFDLLDETKKDFVLKKIKIINSKFSSIKINILEPSVKNNYVILNYLGISMLVEAKKDMMAGKLSALLTRKKFASRDLFDMWFFMENGWGINKESVKIQTGLDYKEALKRALKMVSKLKSDQLLSGLGELVDEKQKNWVKDKLLKEANFLFKLYLEKETKWV